MAKISARGCVKLASASKTTEPDEHGVHTRVRLALRSDGRVLRAVDVHHPTGYPSRGGYSIIGSLSERGGLSSVERFHRYAAQRGFAPESVR